MKDEFRILYSMIEKAEQDRISEAIENQTHHELFDIIQNLPLPFWAKERVSKDEWRMWFVNREYARQFLDNDATKYVNKTDADVWGEEVAADFFEKDTRVWKYKRPELVVETIPDIDYIRETPSEPLPDKLVFSYKWPIQDQRNLVCGILVPFLTESQDEADRFIRRAKKDLADHTKFTEKKDEE